MVSKDIPLRVKAGAVGLSADEYHAQDVVTSGWTGMDEIEVAADEIDSLFADGEIDLEAARNLPCHTGIRLLGGSSHALGRVNPEKRVQLVRGDREVFGLRGRSAEQRVALDLLLDESVGIVSLGGKAGTGKSALALCAGLEAVLERRTHRKVVVFRPLYAVGGQDLGYLPGSESEKMGPWAQAVFDTLEGLASPAVLEEVLSRGMLEVLPLTHIRGRSLHDSFVIVDEAQSLERNVLLTVLSRLGAGIAGGAHPRRRPARQPAGGSPRRRGRGHREAQGPPAVRPHHAAAQRAVADRGAGHRNAGGVQPRRPALIRPMLHECDCRFETSSRGTITGVDIGAVTAIIKVRLDGGDQIVTASITKDAAEDLGLEVGKPATVFIKSSEVGDRRRVAASRKSPVGRLPGCAKRPDSQAWQYGLTVFGVVAAVIVVDRRRCSPATSGGPRPTPSTAHRSSVWR